MNRLLSRSRGSFTLVEVLVVTAVITTMLPVIFTVLFAVIRQEARVYALRTVKNQGDFILNTMKFNIRNYAVTVHNTFPGTDVSQICNTPSGTPVAQNPLVLRDRVGNSFYFGLSGSAIASNSSIANATQTLTDSKVQITNLVTSCNKPSLYSAPVITISYTVSYVNPSAGAPAASLPYQTKVKLRNQ